MNFRQLMQEAEARASRHPFTPTQQDYEEAYEGVDGFQTTDDEADMLEARQFKHRPDPKGET